MSVPVPSKIAFPDWPIYVRRTRSRPQGQLGELHFHPHYEIVWLAEGEAEFFSDFQRYPVQAGALAFIKPGQLHTWFGDWTNFQLRVVGFQPDVFGLWPSLPDLPFFEVDAFPILLIPVEDQPILMPLFETMRLRSKQNPSDPTILFAYLYVLLLEARRIYVKQVSEVPISPAQIMVKQFRRLLEENYKARWQVSAYAGHLSVTVNHLVKIIRQTTGQTPGQMAQDRLFLEARRLLAHSTTSIQAISVDLAFASVTQFTHWFKKIAGTSPSQFRQEILKQFTPP